MFELCPKKFPHPPATSTKIFHFTQQANSNLGIQTDHGYGINVTSDQYRVPVAQDVYYHYIIFGDIFQLQV